jgi:Transcription regulator of the Arc/MetJ class
MKRTNIVVDKSLIEAGLKATGLKTRRELVDYALRELLRRESQKKILELKGKVNWQDDIKATREGWVSE